MDFGKLPIFDVLARRMGWLGQRQEVLAQNIANADTPDYRPLDLKPGPFDRVLARETKPVRLARSDAGHLTAPQADKGRDFKDGRVPGYETAPAGNAVVLEQQLVSVAETQMDFQMMTSLYRKHLGMFRTALGRGGGGG
ncbi:MAG: flagellar basal body protein [Kiloniellales bacterium]|nr:flagellar basal body protein [Kiloniellales bacterium]